VVGAAIECSFVRATKKDIMWALCHFKDIERSAGRRIGEDLTRRQVNVALHVPSEALTSLLDERDNLREGSIGI
jgi:hypothetical protein